MIERGRSFISSSLTLNLKSTVLCFPLTCTSIPPLKKAFLLGVGYQEERSAREVAACNQLSTLLQAWWKPCLPRFTSSVKGVIRWTTDTILEHQNNQTTNPNFWFAPASANNTKMPVVTCKAKASFPPTPPYTYWRPLQARWGCPPFLVSQWFRWPESGRGWADPLC